MTFRAPNEYRVRSGRLASTDEWGTAGLFLIPARTPRRPLALRCICSDGDGWEEHGFALPAWEHVSVSTAVRCPTWDEMAFVKDLFWDAEDCVIQFHPPRSEYVNCHPYVLHLWRPIGIDLPRPPSITVGPLGVA